MEPTPPKPPKATPEKDSAPEQLENLATLEDLEMPEGPVTTTLDTSPKNYYQAIGWLRGLIVKEEERYLLQIRDINFPLYLHKRTYAMAQAMEGQLAWVKCYPQSKGEGLGFKAVWIGTEQNEKTDAGIFVLRGVWQFIPQCRRPVFSIYRNELKSYESRPNNQHLPLIWSDQPPYRFRKDSEERPKFYQIMARLIPQRSCFGFVEQIAEPLEQTPKRVKKPPLNPDGTPKKFDKKYTKKPKGEGEQEQDSDSSTVAKDTVGSPVVKKGAKKQKEAVTAETQETAVTPVAETIEVLEIKTEITPPSAETAKEPEVTPVAETVEAEAGITPPPGEPTKEPEVPPLTETVEAEVKEVPVPAEEVIVEPAAKKTKTTRTTKTTKTTKTSKKAEPATPALEIRAVLPSGPVVESEKVTETPVETVEAVAEVAPEPEPKKTTKRTTKTTKTAKTPRTTKAKAKEPPPEAE